jgi:hypothetical protein
MSGARAQSWAKNILARENEERYRELCLEGLKREGIG